MTSIRRSMITFVLLTTQLGCASFPAGYLSPGDLPEVGSGKSISVTFTGSVEMNGRAQDANQVMLDQWSSSTLKAYKEAGIFDTVRSGLYESDLRAEVELLNYGQPNLGVAFLSGLTLLVIPARASDHLRLTTRFSNAEGDVLAEIVKEETVDTWIWLLLIFLMPSNFPNTIVEQAIVDLSTATIAEAAEQGVFDGSTMGSR